MAKEIKIEELLQVLKESGTGKAKLVTLAEEWKKAGGDQTKFLMRLGKSDLPEGTMEKIERYLKDEPVVPTTTPADTVEGILRGAGVKLGKEPNAPGEAPAEEPKEAISPVKDMNATEAISHIEQMRSKEKLEEIILLDPRITVRQAAEKRLAHLEEIE